jgi:hypothetical protein
MLQLVGLGLALYSKIYYNSQEKSSVMFSKICLLFETKFIDFDSTIFTELILRGGSEYEIRYIQNTTPSLCPQLFDLLPCSINNPAGTTGANQNLAPLWHFIPQRAQPSSARWPCAVDDFRRQYARAALSD